MSRITAYTCFPSHLGNFEAHFRAADEQVAEFHANFLDLLLGKGPPRSVFVKSHEDKRSFRVAASVRHSDTLHARIQTTSARLALVWSSTILGDRSSSCCP
jgi:hypothetical protein